MNHKRNKFPLKEKQVGGKVPKGVISEDNLRRTGGSSLACPTAETLYKNLNCNLAYPLCHKTLLHGVLQICWVPHCREFELLPYHHLCSKTLQWHFTPLGCTSGQLVVCTKCYNAHKRYKIYWSRPGNYISPLGSLKKVFRSCSHIMSTNFGVTWYCRA